MSSLWARAGVFGQNIGKFGLPSLLLVTWVFVSVICFNAAPFLRCGFSRTRCASEVAELYPVVAAENVVVINKTNCFNLKSRLREFFSDGTVKRLCHPVVINNLRWIDVILIGKDNRSLKPVPVNWGWFGGGRS